MNISARIPLVLAFLALLLAASDLRANSSDDLLSAQERAVRRQKDENAKWLKEATDLESEYVKTANDYYKEKDYLKAAENYQKALDITYEGWDIRELSVGGVTAQAPARSKIRLKLDTSNTRRARDQLRRLADIIEEERDKLGEAYFQDLFEKADVALLVKDLPRAYAIYSEVAAAADRIGRKKYAVQAKLKALDKQKGILDQISKPLAEAEQFMAEDKAPEAVDKMKEFEASSRAFLQLSPEIRTRYAALAALPKIKKQGRELDVRQRILLGDAALAREDYTSAARHYRGAATLYPDTVAAQEATKKLAEMQANPDIVEAMKLQEIDVKVRPIIMHAETMFRLRNYEEARKDCERILADYPECTWAKRAREILAQIPRPPQGPAIE